MSSIVTLAGDTFETISRRAYGEESGASRIRQANPGAAEPFVAGVVLQVPDQPDDGQETEDRTNPNQIAITVGGSRFRFWNSVTVTRSLDSIASITLAAPFEPQRKTFRNLFKPLSFTPIKITVGGKKLFNGTLLNVTPQTSADARLLNVTAYSRPGSMFDCTMPASALPVEYNGIALDEIARRMAQPFGIPVVFEGTTKPGAAFDQVSCSVEQTPGNFLSGLARQRDLVVGSNPDGALVFRQEPTGTPVATLEEGDESIISVTPRFNPQQFYSHVTGIEPSIVGIAGGQYTVTNKLVKTLRPHNFTIPDSKEGETVPATKAKAARMYGDAIVYTVSLPGIRNPKGDLWAPGQRVTLLAPGAMIYSKYTFTIRSVAITRTANESSTTLTLMIPGSFSGTIPERLPWDG